MKQKTIMTPCGAVTGSVDEDENRIFKGIRYAAAGRWEYPRVVTQWEGVYPALEFGDNCWQPEADTPKGKLKNTFYYHEFREGQTYTYSEDCLFLNIWAPAHAEHAPVLFFIHGGGFSKGCGHQKPFRGEEWCKRGVILVTINYRVGPLGFCSLRELEAEAGHAGNYGLYDQIAALQWVRCNISAFGGNPENITVMGQSAGAISIALLCVSPLTEGLFSKAIMLSGSGASKLASAAAMERTYPFWDAVKQELGGSLEAMRRASPKQLCQTVKALKNQKGAMRAVMPVVDGHCVPQTVSQAISQGKQHDIPYLLGTTSEDMMPLMLYGGTKKWAILQNERNQKQHSAYMYYFCHPLPGDSLGAWHSSDLWYMFGSLKDCWRAFTEKDRALSCCLMDYTAAFIKTGNPNQAGLNRWEPITRKSPQSMQFADGIARMGKVSFWQVFTRTVKSMGIYQGDTIKATTASNL